MFKGEAMCVWELYVPDGHVLIFLRYKMEEHCWEEIEMIYSSEWRNVSPVPLEPIRLII